MKQLVITADDFGLHRDLDRGIREVCEKGVVTHVSLIANGEGTDEAAQFLKSHPQTSIGIHLNITEGKPLSDSNNLQPLLDKEGEFLGDHLKVGFAILCHPPVAKAVEQEYRAQIEKVLSLGVKILQINAHGHLHLHPYLFGRIMKLAKRYGIPFIRVVDEWPSPRFLIQSLKPWSKTILLWGLTWNVKLCSRSVEGVALNRSRGAFDSGHLTQRERLSQILSHLPDGFTELFCHPGTSSERSRKKNPENYDPDGERKLMTSSETRELIQRSQIHLVNFSMIKNA